MPLLVETARYSTRDPDWLDITRGGADRARGEGKPTPGAFLAPSAGLLYGAKVRLAAIQQARREGRISEGEYQARETAEWLVYGRAYVQEMRVSYRAHRAEWRALLARERVCLVCFCEDATQCHRIVAAGILEKCGAVYLGEAPTVRAISVRQPWAWAILEAGKRVENRGTTWRNAVPGPALLHAAKGCTRAEYAAAASFIRDVSGRRPPELDDLDRGALVGGLYVRGVVAGLVPASADLWFTGPIGLALDEVEGRPPVPCAGALGFFEVSQRVLRNWAPLASMRRHEPGSVSARPPPAPGNRGSQDENAPARDGALLGAAAEGRGPHEDEPAAGPSAKDDDEDG